MVTSATTGGPLDRSGGADPEHPTHTGSTHVNTAAGPKATRRVGVPQMQQTSGTSIGACLTVDTPRAESLEARLAQPKSHAPRSRIEFSRFIGVRDQPRLDANHQSNVPGLYIVGDLVDAPVIKLAFRQGDQIARHIMSELGSQDGIDEDVVDVLIIGAGPAGIGAAMALQDSRLRVVVLDRADPFATIADFPKGKLIFSEPEDLANPDGIWFSDAPKEELVERWSRMVADKELPLQFPEEVCGAKRVGGLFEVRTRVGAGGLTRQAIEADPTEDAENTLKARRIILAAGKRGQPNLLDIPCAQDRTVHTRLVDATTHTDRDVVVVGGGDSAVEAATALAEAGARVTLSYRGDSFHRAKKKNRTRLQHAVAQGNPTLAMGSRPIEITDKEVILRDGENQREVPADDVFAFIGSRPPKGLLRRLGVRMQAEMDVARWLWFGGFAMVTWLFYVLKHKKPFFPFGPGHIFEEVPTLLTMELGFRTIDPSFWGTAIYSLLILVFGVRAMQRHNGPDQKKRYISLMVFQAVFLFGIPELLAPLVIDRPWKVYALTVPWPLSIWSMVDAPGWVNSGNETRDLWTALGWLGVGAVTTFGLIPWYVKRNGQRFCSWMCGCGGLAETLGDFWRHLAPRGRDAKRAEWGGRVILLLAIPVTLLIVNDAWAFVAKDALYSTKEFAQAWYGLMVDFWLASVLGVALYPYFGNRVWCRFFCPLRAWMGVLAKRFSQISIRADDRCIGCGECTRYCQMGIDVERFAQKELRLDNSNSACIQCGICIEVCPMDVLTIDRGREVGIVLDGSALTPPRASWEG